MQWILQDFEDTRALANALDRQGLFYTWHKIIPFVGELDPKPDIINPNDVMLFGAYTLWRYAERHNLRPGVYRIDPFLTQKAWHPYLLNGPDALVLRLSEVATHLPETAEAWFIRPVDDSKALPGSVLTRSEILERAAKVCALDPEEIPLGSLRPDTELLFSMPAQITTEWRLWVVNDQIVTASLYKQGRRVIYRPDIDADALAFAETLVRSNPRYAPAYVLDICRTFDGLKLLETNCINAAGFYAANLPALVAALEGMPSPIKGV